MDYSKFGVTDNDIIFHVTVQPSHGVVDLSDWERHEVKRFSLADIKSDKVLNINFHKILSIYHKFFTLQQLSYILFSNYRFHISTTAQNT